MVNEKSPARPSDTSRGKATLPSTFQQYTPAAAAGMDRNRELPAALSLSGTPGLLLQNSYPLPGGNLCIDLTQDED
nr:hypothetical protein FVER53263_03137 [Fusarium verticillioides]